MIEWTPVLNSTRIAAEAYDPETETTYVRFPDGVEWWYGACPPQVWRSLPRKDNPEVSTSTEF